MKNALFYKYVELDDLDTLQTELTDLCISLNLFGKILIAKEGINGCLSGEDSDIDSLVTALLKKSEFSDIDFKLTNVKAHTFKKLFVRIRDEIVSSDLNVDVNDHADYIEPEELKSLLDNDEDLVLIDMRNDYEYRIGHFKNAIEVPTENFRELPEVLGELLPVKDKNIVTYCTGGVRCEKASAFLKKNGFKNIRQLHGGIIKYGNTVGSDHWEGKCFVFDQRGVIDIDPNNFSEDISICSWCRTATSDLRNCALESCDKFFVICNDCFIEQSGCCSKRCRNILREEVPLPQ